MKQHEIDMRNSLVIDDDTFRLRELIPFIGAIVTGAVGGCVASIQQKRSKSIKETVAAYALAYSITGAFGALMSIAGTMVFYPMFVTGWGELLLLSGSSGLVTALALAAGNVSMRLILKKFGLEVTVNVQRTKPGE